MMFRPVPARWFELVTVHQDLPGAMECLARTGAVELESGAQAAAPSLFVGLDEKLRVYHDFARRYRAYWPSPEWRAKRQAERLMAAFDANLDRLREWSAQADPIIVALERLSREAGDLAQLKEALTYAGDDLPDLHLLATAGPRLQVRLLMMPAGATLREMPPQLLLHRWQSPHANYLLVVGRPTDIVEIDTQIPALKARVIPLPIWLPTADAVAAISERLARLAQEIDGLRSELAALSERLQIARALGDMALIEWLHSHAGDLRASARLAWVTGWTSDLSGTALRRALDAAGLRYVLRVTAAPAGANAPMLFSNPRWVRPFEIFARMLGTPAQSETDPSIAVALVAPLLFGFMFGDVGQGFVIFITGLVVGRRFPFARILVLGGIMASLFGLLFGSVFCREDIIPALWLRPLAAPLTVLIGSVALGVAILSFGLSLDAVQAHWRNEARRWWGRRAGLVLAYLGLLLATMRLEWLGVTVLGAVWYVAGSAALARKDRLGIAAGAAAEFVEQFLRLIVNTVSFVRVGAFALAHAGLSAAVIELSEASGVISYWFVLAFGNVVIIALEGLVVGIQTTRLMLFEFFIRFLTGGGRDFKPLSPPEKIDTSFSQPRGTS